MQLKRVLSILDHLNIGPETIPSLHEKLVQDGFNVSQRTLYRDLIELEKSFKAGRFSLKRYVGEFNKATWILVSTDPTSHREDLFFQSYTTEFLKPPWLRSLSGNTLEDLFGSGISEQTAAGIRQWIPTNAMQHSGWGEFEYVREHYNRLKDILWAIANQRILVISFFDHKSVVERKFRPIKVIYHRGTLHLAGWLIEESGPELHVQELDTLRIQRIINERFSIEDEMVSVDRLLKERFGVHDTTDPKTWRIVLEMGEGPALFLKNRRWHATQVFKRSGESWIMEFQSTINIELVGWIMSWLEHIKVLEPDCLVDLMKAKAQFISSMYGAASSPLAPENSDDPFAVGT
ncbi:MAG: helix-turn-helix transcriptional regulator [Bacteroidota bacterium]